MKTTFIYGIKESNDEIRYVGKSDTPKKRFRQHKTNSRNEKSHKVDWLRHCIKNNIVLELIILEECPYEIWQERECYWISQFSNLVNHDKGGRGGKPIKYAMSYEECKEWVKTNIPRVDSEQKWIRNRANLPEFISGYPRDTYFSRGWISWGDFLGTKRIADLDRKKNFLSYAEAKKWCVDNNIKNITDYQSNIIPNVLPYKPYRTYKEHWTSWNDFLPTQKMKRFGTFLPYNDFVIWVKQNKPEIKNSIDFYKWVRNEKIPAFIPRQPRTAYLNKGWNGWTNFFS